MKKQLILSALLVCTANVTQAGLFGGDDDSPVNVEQQRPGDMGRENTAGIKANARKSHYTESVVKCWQGGEVLFEEKNWRGAKVNKANQIFKGKTKHGNPFYMVGVGETFCYIRE